MTKQDYFWHSAKQEKLVNPNYALINGKEHRYTECSSDKDYVPNWDDSVYLGKGIMSRMNGTIQWDAIPAMRKAGINVEGY